MKILFYLMIAFLSISCQSTNKEVKEETTNRYNILKQKIENGLTQDQAIRKLFMEKMSKGEFDMELNTRMGEIDSINLIDVLAFLESYGYPSITKDGKKLCDGVFYILQHTDLAIGEKYIDQIKENAFTEEGSKKQYALMQDRILQHKNKKQIYGTQSMPRKDSNGHITNEYYIWPIENLETVDSLRKEMGFTSTVEASALASDIEFNRDEQMPNQ